MHLIYKNIIYYEAISSESKIFFHNFLILYAVKGIPFNKHSPYFIKNSLYMQRYKGHIYQTQFTLRLRQYLFTISLHTL